MADHDITVVSPPFELNLSYWDRRFAPLHPKNLLCFPLPESSQANHDHIVKILGIAFRALVGELPFLGGSIVPYEPQPHLRDIRAVDTTCKFEIRHHGNAFSFDALRSKHFPSSALDAYKFCSLPRALYPEATPTPVFGMRANFVEGGLILAASVSHICSDGKGAACIMSLFAEKVRQAEIGASSIQSLPSGPFSEDRTEVVSGKGYTGTIDQHDSWTFDTPRQAQKATVDVVCQNFHISAANLKSLKEIASGPNRISVHDGLLSLLWRSIVLARFRAGLCPTDSTSKFEMPVDIRRHLGLTRPYYGNAIDAFTASIQVEALIGRGSIDSASGVPTDNLRLAAAKIRAGINGCTGDKFRDLVAVVERPENKHRKLNATFIRNHISPPDLMVTSYANFGMYELDFGETLGQIEAFRLPTEGYLPGVPVIMPRCLDGSIEFVILETRETMTCLLEDPVFNRFVRAL